MAAQKRHKRFIWQTTFRHTREACYIAKSGRCGQDKKATNQKAAADRCWRSFPLPPIGQLVATAANAETATRVRFAHMDLTSSESSFNE